MHFPIEAVLLGRLIYKAPQEMADEHPSLACFTAPFNFVGLPHFHYHVVLQRKGYRLVYR